MKIDLASHRIQRHQFVRAEIEIFDTVYYRVQDIYAKVVTDYTHKSRTVDKLMKLLMMTFTGDVGCDRAQEVLKDLANILKENVGTLRVLEFPVTEEKVKIPSFSPLLDFPELHCKTLVSAELLAFYSISPH
ncbi:hypothetical protein PR048_009205, partial [Dryococelus australis]